MEKLADFVSLHISDDPVRLIMNRDRWPDIDMDMAVNSIESRRKLRDKVREWYDEPELVFPLKLSAEQCSSSATGRYKAGLASRIAGKESWNIADLTGGLGVDSWFFSLKAGKVLYNEMQEVLCKAAEHNFRALKTSNISVTNRTAQQGDIEKILDGFKPDIVYMDPARRGEGGRKVFLIEDCTPNVLTLKDEIFAHTRHILLKLSPMADITMACSRLGSTCREVHVVASGGECKELLIWMDREWNDVYSITAVEIHNDGSLSEFTFSPSDEKAAIQHIYDRQCSPPDPSRSASGSLTDPAAAGCPQRRSTGPFPKSLATIPGSGEMPITGICLPERWLFEPGKALMKAGAFNLISERFGIGKLGASTHYYIVEDEVKAEELKGHGKIFRIIGCSLLDKRSIKSAGKDYPRAEVTARNIPMDTDTLRKKLGVSSGDDIHIFGLRSDREGNLLLITSRL